MPTYRIVTLGCKLNQADSSAVEARLRSLGVRRAPDGRRPGDGPGPPADVIVLNTCTVTATADREARQIARRLRRLNPRAVLIATGCYAERDPSSLREATGIDHVVGTGDQAERVGELAAEALGLSADRGACDLGDLGATISCDPPFGSGSRTRAYLKVQDGCDLRCSYCVIPSVRGASRSVPPHLLLRRIEELSATGYREIVFTGVNTGDYGRDLDPPMRLHDLLERALRIPDLGRLRLNSLEPKTVRAPIVRLLAESGGRLARHLQIPLQSGSDDVLRRMRRPYRAGDYARVTEGLRREVPEIAIGADVIVGFPGETDEEFEQTRRLIEGTTLNYLHVFSFSPRPGTPAAAHPDPVPSPIIKERSARLRALARELSRRFRSSFLGRELPALTLREIRPDGRLRALTDNFIDLGIELNGRPAGPLFNRLLAVRITAVTEDDTIATPVACR